MRSNIKYYVHFIRKDHQADEIYVYPDKDSAMDHFRLFYESNSEELYDQIMIYEKTQTNRKTQLIGMLTFIEKTPSGSIIRKDWRNWVLGRPTIWEFHDFDGYGYHSGFITEISDDHAIMESDGMKLWIDDESIYMFR